MAIGKGHGIIHAMDTDRLDRGHYGSGARPKCFRYRPVFKTLLQFFQFYPSFFHGKTHFFGQGKDRVARNAIQYGGVQRRGDEFSVNNKHYVHHPYLIDVFVDLMVCPKHLVEALVPGYLCGIKRAPIIAGTFGKAGAPFAGAHVVVLHLQSVRFVEIRAYGGRHDNELVEVGNLYAQACFRGKDNRPYVKGRSILARDPLVVQLDQRMQ